MLSAFPISIFKPTAQASFRFFLAVSLGFLVDGYTTQAFAQTSAESGLTLSDDALSDQAPESPIRVTVAQEASYKVEKPDDVVKNRSWVQLEYSKYFLDNFFVQFNGKMTAYLQKDHRHQAEGTDTNITQAFVQTSSGQTSFRAGVQTLPWGESILAPVTDEISPRDNRELFNFNLEELRIGQPMLVLDQYSKLGRWTLFWVTNPSFNKNPKKGTAYSFDPFTYRAKIEGDSGTEYGVSWRKNFESSDITLMAASLLDNDYALRMNGDGTVTRLGERYTLAGLSFTYAMGSFVIRGETAFKSSKAYNNATLQIVKKDAIDTYLNVDYQYSPTLSFGVEALNQHVAALHNEVQGLPRDRQSLLLSMTKLLMNDDLSVTVQHIHNRPYLSNLTLLTTSFKWDDHVKLGMNVIFPEASDQRNGLWNVRDQKQIAFKVQYQF